MPNFRPEVLLFLSEKLPLSQKVRYFKGSHFSQCFTLSKAFHYEVFFYAKNCFEYLPIMSSAFKRLLWIMQEV